MSNEREMEDKHTDDEEIEGDEEFDEEEYENGFDDEEDYKDDLEYPDKYVSLPREENSGRGLWNLFDGPSPEKKFKKYDTNSECLDHTRMVQRERQDADYSVLPQFDDELETVIFPRIPTELETMILARIGILEYRKLCTLNKRVADLVESGDLLRERKMIGIKEAFVFMLPSGEETWCAFDQKFETHKSLPQWPADYMFKSGDKESLCAGTHLLVFGSGLDGPLIWTYEVMIDKWYKGPSMVEPRCLFASASCGDFAFVAGGIGLETNDILNSAEKYDPETKSWDPLPRMKEKRKMCSGVFMDDKFYVIGGQNQNGDVFTCAEVFNDEKNTWVKIPDMLNGLTTSQSPPLIAVVNNHLYLFETSSNCLLVYLKKTNTWKNLGAVPVRADLHRGWGVAFKSLGNELLVIGGSNVSLSGRGMTVYTCCPNPNSENPNWKLLDGENSRSHFIMNCTVMLA